MLLNKLSIIPLLLLVSIASASPTTLPSIFCDHMMLQRDIPLPVWGKSEPNTVVTLKLAERSQTATADAQGNWIAHFDPMPASMTPVELSVSDPAGPIETIHDILVGDVWLASGQSNMELNLHEAQDGDAEVARSETPGIRFFKVNRKSFDTPQFTCLGKWDLCNPQSSEKFSAVGYYFAKHVLETEKVPVGIIGSYAGGTKIEAWSRPGEIADNPGLKELAAEYALRRAHMGELLNVYNTQTVPAWQKEHDAWDASTGVKYKAALAEWNTAAATAKAKGKAAPPKPKPDITEPKKPDPPSDNPRHFGGLYNGMINPIVPYAMKGILWYQGESNADDPANYRNYFPAMISDWRKQFNSLDLPFLFVQLPNFAAYPNTDWPALREAQAHTLDLAQHTAMAVTIDIGEEGSIHPKDKKDVADRLFLAAQRLAYGKDVVSESPQFDSMRIDGNAVDVVFKNVAEGLRVGRAVAIPTSQPTEFEIAADDGKFSPADAKLISANTVHLTSAAVAKPIAVRYAWSNTPHVNLYNSAGLPATPFRTDGSPK